MTLINFRSKAIFCFIAIWLLLFPVEASNDWTLKLRKNGIEVFTKSLPGTNIKAVKSVYKVKSSLSSLVGLLLDVPSYTKWIYKCTDAKLIKTESPTEIIYYQLTNVPWPASDRDLVARLTIRQDKENGIVTAIIDCQPDLIAEKPGKVRLKKFDSKYIFSPKADGMLEVTSELFLDPGGNIPAWMINRAATMGPYNTALKMINMLNSEKYNNASFPFIKD
jgi:hypothetical protein